MRLQLDRRWFVFVGAVLAACAFLPSDVTLSPGVSDCSVTTGLDNLHVYIRTDRKWQDFTFDGSKLVRSSTREPNSRNWNNNARRNFADFEGKDFGKEFPNETRVLNANQRLGFPAAYSPDKRSFAAVVITVDPTAALVANWNASQVPKRLILRSDTQEHRLGSLAGFSIYTLAWKPDSGRFAVIERNYDRTPRSPIAAITPDGGVVYSDVVLSVYDGSGVLVCQSLLASKVSDSSVEVDWTEK